MTENLSLFKLFQEYEKDKTGGISTDLNGNFLLKTELTWLNRFVAEEFENQYELSYNTKIIIEDLSPDLWNKFTSFIYNNLGNNKNDISKIIKRIISFFKWISSNELYSKSESEIFINALKFEQKKYDRYMKIYKHFSLIINSKVYIPDPTENIESIELNEAFFKAQIPEIKSKYNDEFKVISNNKKNSTIYLKSLNSSDSILFKVDSHLFRLISIGDIYPLTLGLDQNSNTLLIDYTYPLVLE